MRTHLAVPALALAGILGLAACGGGDDAKKAEDIINQLSNGSVDIGTTPGGGSGSISVNGDDGSGTFGGGEIPDEVPDDLIPPFDYDVASSLVGNDASGGGFFVTLNVDASYDDVVAYYDDKLPDASSFEGTAGDSRSKTWTVDSGDSAGVNVVVNENPSGVTVTIAGGTG